METSWLIALFDQYRHIALFAGAFLFGEVIILSALVLALDQGHSLWPVFLIAFGATLLADMAWFFVGTHYIGPSRYWKKIEEKHATRLEALRRKHIVSQAFYLIFFKFLYGTRVVTILYVALEKMPFWKFLFYNTIGTLIWLTILIGAGAATWQGIAWALTGLHIAEYTLVIGLGLIICYKLLTLWITTRKK